MVSNTRFEEGWYWIEKFQGQDVCVQQYPQDELTFVLHYCQSYSVGPMVFNKYKVKNNLLSCQSLLLREPTKDILNYSWGMDPYGK